MKQIFAMFSKDARRFWPEILASIAILVALVLVYPHQWRLTNQPAEAFVGRRSLFFGSSPLSFLAGSLVVLVPVSWWLLIARLVHGERLVGNTQFWLTRPYEWHKFLAAKLLFLAVFLCMPFFAAQCALLIEAGFNPLSFLPGLFYNLFLATGIFVLPLVTLSAVTSGFGRLTLVVLGVILFIGGMALVNSLMPSDTTGGVMGSLGDELSFAVLLCGCGSAVLVQYARRKLLTAWLLIGTVALSLSALALIDPDQSLMGRHYPSPASNAPPPANIVYAANELHQPTANDTNDKSELEITIPLRATGVATGHVVIPVALKAVIDGPNGARWESQWNAISNVYYLPGTLDSTVSFRMRRSVYDRFKATPVDLRLMFAVDQARAATTSTISVASGEFTVPEFGICTPQWTWGNFPTEITGINCRSAMRRPHLTYVTAQWSEDPCSNRDTKGESLLGTTWIGSFDTDPAEFGVTSVWETPLGLSNSWAGYNKGYIRLRQLCSGTPVTFTRYELAGHTQIAIAVSNFQLPKLAIGDQYQFLLR